MSSPDTVDGRPHIQPQSEEFQAPEGTFAYFSGLKDRRSGNPRTTHMIWAYPSPQDQVTRIHLRRLDAGTNPFPQTFFKFAINEQDVVTNLQVSRAESAQDQGVYETGTITIFEEMAHEIADAQRLAAQRER